MKTLILNGSPRKKGDTASLLNIIKPNLKGDIKVVDAYYCNVKLPLRGLPLLVEPRLLRKG